MTGIFLSPVAPLHLELGVTSTLPIRLAAMTSKIGYCSYNNLMELAFDPLKRAKTLAERGLDFADAALVFEGDTLEVEDDRRDYGEIRMICFGCLPGAWWS